MAFIDFIEDDIILKRQVTIFTAMNFHFYKKALIELDLNGKLLRSRSADRSRTITGATKNVPSRIIIIIH